MLFTQATLTGIADGAIDLAFRRWRQARVRPGGRQRTAIGVIEVDAVDVVSPDDISTRDAARAGFRTRGELLDALDGRDGQIHRVRFHLAGPDPRVELRQQGKVSASELAEIRRRLDRYDAASGHGPWTRTVLELIRDHPETRAGDLAARLGRETQPFKLDVRKLKELGLTESLRIGYRLSPRGRTVLRHLS